MAPAVSASTVPPNGDLNPYGVAFVPPGFPSGGLLKTGDVIVSNFNNALTDGGGNAQGTGTTVVKVNPHAPPTVFFENRDFPGFSTALGVLSRGFVLLGQVPSTDGSGACNPGPTGQEEGNVGQGSLLVIDARGRLRRILTSAALLDGPWDLTLEDFGSRANVYVSDALNGTVTRIELRIEGHDGDGDDNVFVERETRIASGYVHHCDGSAFIVGPTGLALDRAHDVLYVSSTGDNAIFAVPNAHGRGAEDGFGRGKLIVSDATHLHGPLGLVRAPNGDLISAQGDAPSVNPDPTQPSEIVEFNAQGGFVDEFSIDSASGSAFGLALTQSGGFVRFAAVDDGINVLDIWNVKE